MKITQQAVDAKAGMTLDEAARIGAYVGFRGQIKELWIGK